MARPYPLVWVTIVSILFLGSALGASVRVATPAPYVDLVEAWGIAAGVQVRVKSFETNDCIRRVGRGEFDLAVLGGTISEGQKSSLGSQPGAVPRIYQVGWEAATLIVHNENPLAALKESQVRRLFQDSECVEGAPSPHSWSDLPGLAGWSKNPIGRIVPRLDTPSGEAVENLFMEDCPLEREAYQVTKDAVCERVVAASPEALGVVYRLRHIGLARPVPVLAEGQVRPATPSTKTLTSGEYPFGHRIWLVAPKIYYHPNPAAKLTSFAQTPEGQFEVARHGFYPLR